MKHHGEIVEILRVCDLTLVVLPQKVYDFLTTGSFKDLIPSQFKTTNAQTKAHDSRWLGIQNRGPPSDADLSQNRSTMFSDKM